ncbi:TonB-dependent receptor [Sandaracinobacteroides saxicola]|uniref:TonB-dependent receptor n=1 Tax=Sandaracinobacteroides saxicola TaxID=2759707 RepID=A0A7G5IJA0_9SPHN|nr:TonB-dependent receptor [Sandaracinobacteroides saxicola]QMW23442.1 TonB-dependent receptor [Sandaracinobacteroides saxicola]
MLTPRTITQVSLAALALSMLGGTALFAQAAPAPTVAEADVEEIIVTARKRAENLQEVPLAISAFTASRIEEQGIKSIADIAQQTPGLSFRQAFGRNGDRPVIRGMSNIQGNPNAAFFVDGIFFTGSISAFNLDNLERVEVIKGPQAALFGRATFAGAINFITRQPDNTPRGRLSVTFGEDGLQEYTGYVSGPLITDKLWASVDAKFYRFAGQYTNLVDPEEKLGREKSLSYGLTLRAAPTENLTITARYSRSQDNDGAYAIGRLNWVPGQTAAVPGVLGINNNALNCFLPNLRPGVFGPAPALRPVADNRARGYNCGQLNTPTQFALNSNIFRQAGIDDALNRDILRSYVKVEYDLNDWTLTGTGAYNRRRQTVATDQDYSDLRSPGFETIDRSGTKDYTLEFRVASPAASRVRGLAGVYYYREKDLPGNYSASLPAVVPPPPAVPFTRNSVFLGSVKNRAVFGQLEVDITDTLTASAEARYQVEDLTTSGTSSTVVAGQTFTRSIVAPLGVAQYKSFLPRFTVNWKATDDVMLYGVVARGNKPGGFNSGVYSALYEDSEVARLVGLGLDTFREESSWNYEIGAKTQFMDRRVTVNVAAYNIEWKNQQLTQTIQVARRDGVLGSVSFTSNVGKSRVRGFELESSAKVTDWLELRLGYAFQDAKIRDFVADDQADLYITAADINTLNSTAPLPAFIPAPSLAGTGLTSFAPCLGASPDPRCTAPILTYAQGYLTQLNAATPARFAAVNALLAARGNAAGNSLPRVPKHQITLGGTINVPITDTVKALFTANLAYESKRYIQVDNLGWSGDSYNLGLRAGVEFDGFSITAFMTNALNDRTPVDILRSIDNRQTYFRPALRPGEATANLGGVNVSSANLRDFAVTAPRLRNFGVTAAYKF